MRVYISTDLEGISGITVWEQVKGAGTWRSQEACRLLMGDVNAVVQGCLDGGGTHVCIMDGHGGGTHGFNLIPELMHPGAKYATGRDRPQGDLGLDKNFDCAMLIGYHAMNRTPDGVLAHTQSYPWDDYRYWYNDIECGEIAQSALICGHYGVPVVMVSGDDAACREARRLLGDDLVTVAVKEGYSNQCCRMLPSHVAARRLRAAAAQALSRVAVCKPCTMQLPIRGRLEMVDGKLPESATAAQIAAAPTR